MPRPTEEHKKLEWIAGDWRGEETMHPSPWAPEGGKAEGRSNCRLALNGFAVLCDYEQKKDGVSTFTGHGVFTYDSQRQCFVQHWFDCFGGAADVLTGNFEGKILTMTGSNPRQHMRSTTDYSTSGRLIKKMEFSQDGQNWSTLFEGEYTC